MDDNVKKVSFTNGDLPNCVHVTDPSIELDMDLDVVYEGTVSYREKDPTLFMESSTMQTTAMSQAGIALKFLKPDEVNPKDPSPAGALLADMVRARLAEYWTDRGVEIIGVEISKFAFTQESSRMVNMFTQMAEFKDPAKAAQKLLEVQMEAQKAILKDAKEAAGWGMSKWKCLKCGTINTGKFCSNCGYKREWTCDCGTVNLGRFCTECGKLRLQVEIKRQK